MTNTSAFKSGLLGNVGGALKSPFSIAKNVAAPVNKAIDVTKGHLYKSGGKLKWKPSIDWAKDINLGGALPWRWDIGFDGIPRMRNWKDSSMGREQYRQGVRSGNIRTRFMDSGASGGQGFSKNAGMGLLGLIGAAAAAGADPENPFEPDPEPFEYDMFDTNNSGALGIYNYYDE